MFFKTYWFKKKETKFILSAHLIKADQILKCTPLVQIPIKTLSSWLIMCTILLIHSLISN
jgi:hypothetical protein